MTLIGYISLPCQLAIYFSKSFWIKALGKIGTQFAISLNWMMCVLLTHRLEQTIFTTLLKKDTKAPRTRYHLSRPTIPWRTEPLAVLCHCNHMEEGCHLKTVQWKESALVYHQIYLFIVSQQLKYYMILKLVSHLSSVIALSVIFSRYKNLCSRFVYWCNIVFEWLLVFSADLAKPLSTDDEAGASSSPAAKAVEPITCINSSFFTYSS